MKKTLLILLISLFLLPITVKAEEYCKIVSGNGKDIGSEIACGTEHFYIIENKDDTVKMLSKYNLYVGAIFNKINLNPNEIYEKLECQSADNCYQTIQSFFDGEEVANSTSLETKIKEKYDLDYLARSTDFNNYDNNSTDKKAVLIQINGEVYTEGNKMYRNDTFKLYPYTIINEDTEGFALQNELALGVNGDKGNANYPLYATFIPFSFRNYSHTKTFHDPEDQMEFLDDFEDGYVNFEFKEESLVGEYLNFYKQNLDDMGYDVIDVDLLSIKDIKELVFSISGKELPLSEWYSASITPEFFDSNDSYYTVGDLKEFVPDEHKWLWNTTFWTKTFTDTFVDNDLYVYFVSTQGDICFTGNSCFGIPRAGLRPTVTIPKDIIKYLIKTKTDGNGTIEVVDTASGGETISFKVKAKKGLKLVGVTITTDSGEQVEFNEEDITVDSTGIMSISTNKFTMPFENVTIEGSWLSDGITVPDTLKNRNVWLIVGIFILSLIGTVYIDSRKSNK